MNTRAAVLPVVDADATIERFDAIAEALEETVREVLGDRDLERQHAIRVMRADRCLGPA